MLLAVVIVYLLLFGAIFVFNTRVDRRLVAQGKCPSCCGLGADFIQMNGLEGCFHCENTGTLDSHNRYRALIGLKPLT